MSVLLDYLGRKSANKHFCRLLEAIVINDKGCDNLDLLIVIKADKGDE